MPENPDKYRGLLSVAIRVAATAHGNTINKDGTPYILHPLRLMMKAEGYVDKITAVLHDTVEDTSMTLALLEEAGFPPGIVGAIDHLTKRDGEDYDQFIHRISGNSLASRVKLLDLYDNIDLTRLPEITAWDLARTARYHHAIKLLEATLREADFIRGGQTSAKHSWKDSCYYDGTGDLIKHLWEIAEYAGLADDLPTEIFAVRELLETKPIFTAFHGSMPITREFRLFVRDGITEREITLADFEIIDPARNRNAAPIAQEPAVPRVDADQTAPAEEKVQE